MYIVAGASGFVGQALCAQWRERGLPFKRLVRRPVVSDEESQWDPQTGAVDLSLLRQADLVVNLAGVGVSEKRLTTQRKQAILNSRLQATSSLVTALNQITERSCRLINASGISYYGNSDAVCDESSPAGTGFLAGVCQQWEACLEALTAPHSCVAMRIGMVLGAGGGALAEMLKPLRWGIAGRLGHGRQWMSWISRRDLLGVIDFLAERRDLSGAVNAVSPQTMQNEAFMRCLAGVMRRPFLLHAPAWALRLRFGEMADELLLSSNRICPKTLQEHGFSFQDPELESCLRLMLEKPHAET